METPGTPANLLHPYARPDTKAGPQPLTKAPRRIRVQAPTAAAARSWPLRSRSDRSLRQVARVRPESATSARPALESIARLELAKDTPHAVAGFDLPFTV